MSTVVNLAQIALARATSKQSRNNRAKRFEENGISRVIRFIFVVVLACPHVRRRRPQAPGGCPADEKEKFTAFILHDLWLGLLKCL